MPTTLSAVEIACLKKLAERFEKGQMLCGKPSIANWEEIGLTNDNYKSVLTMFLHHGYIRDPTHGRESEFVVFTIDASTVKAVRIIAEEDKKK